MPSSVRLTVFIVLAVILAAGLFLLFFYEPLKKAIYRHNPARLFYGKINAMVLDHDYYLINELKIEEGGYEMEIDHLIGGDKYLYLIFDLFCQGGISLEPDDAKWIVYTKEGKRYIDNPLIAAEGVLAKLAAKTGIDPSLMVAIVAVNGDCFLSPFRNREEGPLLVPLNRLRETVESYEKQDVPRLEKEELWQTIHDLYEIYKRRNRG